MAGVMAQQLRARTILEGQAERRRFLLECGQAETRPDVQAPPSPAPPTGGGTPGGLKARRAELGGSAAAEMSVLRPMDKLPDLNRATILVGTEGALGRLPASPGPCASSSHSAPVRGGRAHYSEPIGVASYETEQRLHQ